MIEELIVKNLAKMGGLTYGGQDPTRLSNWSNGWQISETEVDAWMEDPEPNPSRDRAFKIASLLLEGTHD